MLEVLLFLSIQNEPITTLALSMVRLDFIGLLDIKYSLLEISKNFQLHRMKILGVVSVISSRGLNDERLFWRRSGLDNGSHGQAGLNCGIP